MGITPIATNMSIVTLEPFLRLELKYGRYNTVLKGSEMDILGDAYRERTQFILSHLRRYKLSKKEKMLPFTVSMLACLEAYNIRPWITNLLGCYTPHCGREKSSAGFHLGICR